MMLSPQKESTFQKLPGALTFSAFGSHDQRRTSLSILALLYIYLASTNHITASFDCTLLHLQEFLITVLDMS